MSLSQLLPVLLLISQISNSLNWLLWVNGKKAKYCFDKSLNEKDTISFTYIISSEDTEEIKVTFTSLNQGVTLYEDDISQSGEYYSQILDVGHYSLCFIPQNTNQYYISFDYYSYIESGIIKDLAQDKEVKQMSEGVNELKTAFQDFEKNLKFIVDRRSRHNIIWVDIIKSIKWLTFWKIAIISLLSVFQVCVIRIFFGPDKRVTTVKGAFQDGW